MSHFGDSYSGVNGTRGLIGEPARPIAKASFFFFLCLPCVVVRALPSEASGGDLVLFLGKNGIAKRLAFRYE